MKKVVAMICIVAFVVTIGSSAMAFGMDKEIGLEKERDFRRVGMEKNLEKRDDKKIPLPKELEEKLKALKEEGKETFEKNQELRKELRDKMKGNR